MKNEFITIGSVVYIDVSNKSYPEALVAIDKEYLPIVAELSGRWSVNKSSDDGKVYVRGYSMRQHRIVYLDRVIVEDVPENMHIFYADGDTFNCTRENLILKRKRRYHHGNSRS